MRIQGIYAALATANMAASEAFYASLFGRGPDDRPMEGLIQWRDVAGGKIQFFRDVENAGNGRLTIVVPDMVEVKTALTDVGTAGGRDRPRPVCQRV